MSKSTLSQSKHKIVEPLSSQTALGKKNYAADMVRSKLSAVYASDTKAKPATERPSQAFNTVQPQGQQTKHQKFMYELRNSGKSLAEIQTAWHEYYVALPDTEKHQVWQEFYQENDKAKKSQATAKTDPRSSAEVKDQIIKKVRARAKPKNPHIQSLLFGLGMGSIVVVLLLFSFFNERIIAPFITPSRSVSNTPIITDLSSTTVDKESKVIIPKINVEIPVVYDEPSIQEDRVQKALERGVLHYATTPNPGELGNSVIFGHSSNNILNQGKYKFAFVLLNRLENGDTFMLQKDGKRYVYKVFEKRVVAPTEISVLDATDRPATATLITCDPPGTSINRLVVIGEQISPSPDTNIASTAAPVSDDPAILPSNSPSLWQRFTNWL
jgi:LPXTG-site transpeptidase (sortase) family protein